MAKMFYILTHPDKAVEAAEEWKKLGICALGWSRANFCKCRSEEEVRTHLVKNFDEGEAKYARAIWRFIHEIKKGYLVLAYCRNNIIAYVGTVKGHCEYNTRNSVGDLKGNFYCAHQREVKWWDEPTYFDRNDLPQYYAKQLGKHGVKIAEVLPDSKGFEGFINIIKTCANSRSKLPGINEDMVKAGLVKYLNCSLDRLENGLVIKTAEPTIGEEKRSRPDFIAEDKNGRTVLVECKGNANENTVDQILDYSKKYGRGKETRLMIVAFRINETCKLAAMKAGHIELVECDLDFHSTRLR